MYYDRELSTSLVLLFSFKVMIFKLLMLYSHSIQQITSQFVGTLYCPHTSKTRGDHFKETIRAIYASSSGSPLQTATVQSDLLTAPPPPDRDTKLVSSITARRAYRNWNLNRPLLEWEPHVVRRRRHPSVRRAQKVDRVIRIKLN